MASGIEKARNPIKFKENQAELEREDLLYSPRLAKLEKSLPL